MLRIIKLGQQFKCLVNQSRMCLTKQEAALRSKYFQNYTYYDLYIELLKGKQYRAKVDAKFEIKTQEIELFLDYQGPKVSSIILNGQQVNGNCQRDNKIYLPKELLQENNTIQIIFVNQYSTNGHGLHSFIDSEQSQYVYSQSEPFHASKIFPCFDQPDIKGHFKLSTYSPQEWTVISNEQECKIDPTIYTQLNQNGLFLQNQQFKINSFTPTKPLSTYLYAILAGPYEEIKCPSELLYNSIPQSLYCRKSLLHHLKNDANNIFKTTSGGMKFFEELFGHPYPFSKYDQIFCPEYSTGAMENAGAVTINDLYLFREPVPKNQRASRDNTIIHELSHMWFGDLVTMKWWDDLWLNESFAEFIAHLCQNEIQTEDVNYWVQFLERKLWGYVTDEKSTTHPIYSDVQNTDQAENVFDGITYAKGAALLKQIYFLMGKQRFTESMSLYFNQYAYKNTTLDDFFGKMSQIKDVDWKQFKEDWIMTSGFNTLSYHIDNTNLIINQTGNYLRQHNLKIGIINQGEIAEKHITIQKQARNIIDLQGLLSDESGIILNYDDECYVKAHYSPQQTKVLLQKIPIIKNSLNRLVVIHTIFDQVRDGITPFTTFAEGIIQHLQQEDDETVLKIILQWCSAGIDFYTPIQMREQTRIELNRVLEQMLHDCKNENQKLILRSYYVAWCRTPESIEKIKFEEIGIKDGWQMIYNSYLYDRVREDLVTQLMSKDTDHFKHLRFLKALEQRHCLWEHFLNYNSEESVQMIAQAMRAYNHEKFIHQEKEELFFNAIKDIFDTKDAEYSKCFFHNLYPKGDNLMTYLKLSEKVLSETKNDHLIKLLKESIDTNKRRIKAYSSYN